MDVLPLDLTGDGALRAAVAADREVTRMEGVRLDHLAQYLGEAAADWEPPAWMTPGSEQAVRLGGAGTPDIPEFAVCEVAAALGLTQPAATGLCADVLDLAYRLKRITVSVRAGVLSFARARVIARRTRELSVEQARLVEERLCRPRNTGQGPQPMVALVPMSRLRSVIDQAVVTVRGPEGDEEAEARIATSLYVDVVHEAPGATDVAARLASADAGRLDRRLDEVAGWLADAGDARPKKVLRAVALGLLADPGLLQALAEVRSEPATLGADGSTGTATQAEPMVAGIAGLPAGLREKFANLTSTVLYLHMDRCSQTWCEEKAGVLTNAQARELVGHSNVTIRPVLDLSEDLTYTGYVAPPRLKEQLALLNAGYCTFPYCHRRARAGDVDHQLPAGRGGRTRSDNTHRLCRKHHRAKDKGRWQVARPLPGLWIWVSPAGAIYLVGNGITTPLNGIFARQSATPYREPQHGEAPGREAPDGADPVGESEPPGRDPTAGRDAALDTAAAHARDGASSGTPSWDPWTDWDPLTPDEHEFTYGLINTG